MKMKALRESTESQLQEKMKLCNNLKMYIDEQEGKMQEILISKGEDVLFNVSNSVRMFMKQISELQSQLSKQRDENSRLNVLNREKDVEVYQLKDQIKTEYVPKLDYDLLMKEKEIVARTRFTPLKVINYCFIRNYYNFILNSFLKTFFMRILKNTFS